jgi:lipoprotein-anchoring transpeptidase ErfK/SrfK
MLAIIASLVVDLSDQKLYVYNPDHQLIRTVLVSTGKRSSPTPTGAGKVLSKYRSITMRGAPWQEAAGQRFGVPRSHGCVRVPSSQARWLYEHTPIGTPVTIRA